jgi:tetratricopeptide (TPR) repeat protein
VADQDQTADIAALLASGQEAVQEGRADAALMLLGQAVAEAPRSAEAQCQYGLACQLARRDADAIAAFSAALALAPALIEAHHGLATALAATGQHEAALAAFETLRALAPELPEGEYGRAACLHALGRHAPAEAGFAATLALDPDFAEAHAGRAGCLLALGRAEDAVIACEQALLLDPGFVAVRQVLAAALAAQRRYREAIAQWREALALAPDSLAIRRGLADTLHTVGRAEEAAEAYAACLKLAAGDAGLTAELESGRAAALLELGEIAAAAQGLERAISLRPDQLGPYLALANARRVRPGDAMVARLEALAARRHALPADERIVLCFALHKVCTDLGEPIRGFAFLEEGAALRRHQLAYDEAAELNALDAPRRAFTADLMARLAGQGGASALPVFIVGMPRSGSTLIEQMLASHPRVVGGGERGDFTAALRAAARRAGRLDDSDAFVAALDAPVLRRIGASYAERLESAAAGTKAAPLRITDKLPDNFRHLGLIHLALPNARIIHTRRDPVDTCLSCYSKLFAAPHPYSYDLGTLGRYWRAYDRLMAHWRSVLPPGVMLEVQYEDVVNDFPAAARRIVAHCGLDWDDACLDFHRTARPVRTASVVQVRQPIYRSSVGRWRPDAATLRPLLAGLGLDDAA